MKKNFAAIGIFLSISLIFLFFNPLDMFPLNFSSFNSPSPNFLSGGDSLYDKNNQTTNNVQDEKPQRKHNLVYVVKEYNGRIAIFEENSETPFKITDVRLSELPDGDKKLLSKGIPASSSRELNCILEDYCS